MRLEDMACARRAVAHILFMDIVRYSLLPPDRQQCVYQELQEAVSATEAYQHSLATGHLVCRSTGDGMALLFFDSVESPLRCALQLADILRDWPQVPLRMGVHSGEVFLLQDINGMPDVAGEGINTAQRVMDCGDTGHILVSSAVAEPLQQAALWPGLLRYLGICEVKHGKRLALWNLCSATAGNRQLPQVVVDWKTREAQENANVRYPVQSQPIHAKKTLVVLIYLLVMAVSCAPWALLYWAVNLSGISWFFGIVLTIVYIGGLIAYLVFSPTKKPPRE